MPPKRKEPTNKIINFYEHADIKKFLPVNVPNPNFSKTQMKLPARIAVIAATGIGKSNCVMNYIKLCSEGKGSFCHIHVFHQIQEALYDLLADKCKDNITFYTRLCDMPEPKDLQPKDGHNLVIFDDCMALSVKDQQKIINYFIIGRKVNGGIGLSSIYISQSYFAIPQRIRAQLNYIFLLKNRSNIDLGNIITDTNIGIDRNEFKAIYNDAIKDEMHFLKISIQEKEDDRLLSKDFDGYYEISGLDNDD
jgi:hypothetical protein